MMTEKTMALIRAMQNDEATDARIYAFMARRSKGANRQVLERIAHDEMLHRDYWGAYTKQPAKINWLKVSLFMVLGTLFGATFLVNFLEAGETEGQEKYRLLAEEEPRALDFLRDEARHEEELSSMIVEERLRYIGSMVLGLNDALVELTGALAGFTLALGDTRTAGLAGLITGIAATLSMAASEYLSKKADPNEKHPLKASVYTGIAYMITVALLLLPYFVFSSPYVALTGCLSAAACIIFAFTGFVSVVRKEPFKPAFLEMLGISFGVAFISFIIGWLANSYLGVGV
ncbi:MAG: VIT1/CCC1 transporter family protein [Desulfovibrionaceae bacterium]|nr:VIT1/CCC1 transporter family protein [Desulfovibrionaceae bacterium]